MSTFLEAPELDGTCTLGSGHTTCCAARDRPAADCFCRPSQRNLVVKIRAMPSVHGVPQIRGAAGSSPGESFQHVNVPRLSLTLCVQLVLCMQSCGEAVLSKRPWLPGLRLQALWY